MIAHCTWTVYGRVRYEFFVVVLSYITNYIYTVFSLGEVCSHVAAVLFKVEACFRLGINTRTSTSHPCVWNQAFSKKVRSTVVNAVKNN